MNLTRHGIATAILLLLPLPLIGQGGVGFSIGSRSYHSGPVVPGDGDATLRPTRAVEYMAHLQLAAVRGVGISLLLGGFTADFVTSTPSVSIGLKDAIDGYGARVALKAPVATLSRGAMLALQLEGGMESFRLADEKAEIRAVLSAGPTLHLPLAARWDLRLSALGGALLRSPFTSAGLPEGATNRNPWWITWRVGLVRHWGAR